MKKTKRVIQAPAKPRKKKTKWVDPDGSGWKDVIQLDPSKLKNAVEIERLIVSGSNVTGENERGFAELRRNLQSSRRTESQDKTTRNQNRKSRKVKAESKKPARIWTQKEKDKLMKNFLGSITFAFEVGDWRKMPETGEDPDE